MLSFKSKIIYFSENVTWNPISASSSTPSLNLPAIAPSLLLFDLLRQRNDFLVAKILKAVQMCKTKSFDTGWNLINE